MKFTIDTKRQLFTDSHDVRIVIERTFTYKELMVARDPRQVMIDWALSVLVAAGASDVDIRRFLLSLIQTRSAPPKAPGAFTPWIREKYDKLSLSRFAWFLGLCAAEAARRYATLPKAEARYL